MSCLQDYYKLIKSVAHTACYKSNVIDVNDLYQVGLMATLRALNKFDPSKNTNKESFIKKAVQRAIYNEAARFMGVFTVDHRTTKSAVRACKTYNNSENSKQLKFLYEHKSFSIDDNERSYESDNVIINDILGSIINDTIDLDLIKYHILGNLSIQELAIRHNVSKSFLYKKNVELRKRISDRLGDN